MSEPQNPESRDSARESPRIPSRERPDPAGEEERLREIVLRAERDARIGRLLRGIAHDLNNPLSTISGFAELLAEAPDLPEERREWAAIVQESAERAATIARTLLDFGRGADDPSEGRDAGEVLEGTLALSRLSLERRGVRVSLEVDQGVPPVRIRAGDLQHIALNLLANAAEALEGADGGTVEIRVRCGDDRVEIDFADDGPGIPEEIRERVLEPFVSTREEGAGIGLSVAAELARQWGGELRVPGTSRLGGALVRLEVPVWTADRERGGAAGDASGAPTGRALVLDGAPELRLLTRHQLRRFGLEVDEADSVAEARSLVEQGRYDLVVAEIESRAEGEAIVAGVEAGGSGALILTTGGVVGSGAEEWFALVSCPVLRKPYGPAELRALVERVLSRR